MLGIGANGHIGFNEPSCSLGSRTRVKILAPRTFADNSRLLEEGQTQPGMAITMGIGTIMDARRILLLAMGEYYRWVREQSDSIASQHGGSADHSPWFHPTVDAQ